jgi:hypothetical protein
MKGCRMTTYVYEEPSSLRVADWEDFCAAMRKEVAQHPDRDDAIEALRFAEFMLDGIRREVPQSNAA